MDANQQEARTSLAIQAYKQGQFKPPTAAAKAFDVSKNTVRRRLRGTAAQQGAIAATRLLTPNEEDALMEWILSMDRRGIPHQATIKQMVTLYLAERASTRVVGSRWILRFINRHNQIKSKYNRNTTISEQSVKILS
jgi:hypothetical protein